MNRRNVLKAATAGALVAGSAVLASPSWGLAAQPEADVKVGCMCNWTGKDVTVYITSHHGVIQAFLKKETCLYFNFYDDKKRRVLSAFAKPNDLVSYFAFIPLANACLLIEADAKEAKKAKEVASPKDAVTTVPV